VATLRGRLLALRNFLSSGDSDSGQAARSLPVPAAG
jgi:hypothetical protein